MDLPRHLTLEQLKQISDAVGVRTGWDSSRVRDKRGPLPRGYCNVARRFLTPQIPCWM